MYQDNSQRKWQTGPISNAPSENLKTFIQKRIRAIMAKEWWDFIVNVNTLNSDHASLLYSLANLCPSFSYFLQTREKELQLIIKRRPVVKPRIFSGTERLDTTPEPIVPKQLPLVTRRNSATELVKILNELYPNENTSKAKPRSYGPASKQKKSPTGPAKKNSVSNSITGEMIIKIPKNQAALGRTPLLKRLLADESQKENANITNIKKIPQVLSLPALLEEEAQFSKPILSNTNYNLNQNRSLEQSPRKIKKIIKVKKKRYVYSNALSDSKHRLKYILEDETPNLSLKLIKKHRIKKCTVNVARLKDSVLKYYEDLRRANDEKLRLSLEESELLRLALTEQVQVSGCEVADQLSSSNIDTTSPADSNPNVSANPPDDSNVKVLSPVTVQPSEKNEVVDEKSISTLCQENTPIVEKLNPRELKNMYCHGGIVPLGKLLMSDKMGNNKHFLSLKEKKTRDVSNDALILSKPKDANVKSENSEVETKNYDSNLDSCESDNKERPIDPVVDKLSESVLDGNNPSNGADLDSGTIQQVSVKRIRRSTSVEVDNLNVKPGSTGSENMAVNNTPLVVNVSESCFNENATDERIKCTANVNGVSETSQDDEAAIINGEKHLDIDDVELSMPCELSDVAERIKTISEIEKLIGISDNSETTSDSLDQIETREIVDKLINETLNNRSEDLDYEKPIAKRPRLEINLSKMKLVSDISKALVEEGKVDDRVCKMCKSSFESVESWNDHFVNKVPKCTPNLQVTWDNPEHSLLTD